MNRLRKLVAMLLFALFATTVSAISDSRVFAYAEANFPSIFTGAASAGQYQQYNYRCYQVSGNCVAVDASGVISVMGPYTGGAIIAVGAVSAFEGAITAWEATMSSISPNIVSATCANSVLGACASSSYQYGNGFLTGIGSYIYVKNIGGSGTLNVTVKTGNFTENTQFNVASGTQYVLHSVVPVKTTWLGSNIGHGNDLIVSASFHGVSEITQSRAISPGYIPARAYVPYDQAHWEAYTATGIPSSALEVDRDITLKIITTLNSPGGSLPSGTVATGPTGLAFDGSNFWNADWNTKTIYKFDTAGNVITSFKSPGSSPTGLAFDGTYLWNADYFAAKIYKMDTTGKVIASFSSPGTRPTGLVFDGTYLWNADDMAGKIYKLDATGAVIASFASSGSMGLAFDGTYLWCAEYNSSTIYKLDTAGNRIAFFYSPGLNKYGLAFDGTYLWSTDGYAAKIYKLAMP